jgi:predicted alternative tryptophan synthase beta-subunit
VYYAKKQGITSLTTETGAGQWGTALSEACAYFDLPLTVYMVKVSAEQKPYRKAIMEMNKILLFFDINDSPFPNHLILYEILLCPKTR